MRIVLGAYNLFIYKLLDDCVIVLEDGVEEIARTRISEEHLKNGINMPNLVIDNG